MAEENGGQNYVTVTRQGSWTAERAQLHLKTTLLLTSDNDFDGSLRLVR